MPTTHAANIDVKAALAEAEELYRARNPRSFAQHRDGLRHDAGRQHALGHPCRPVPADYRARRGRAAVGSGRPRIRRFPERVHSRHLWSFASEDPRCDHPRARGRAQFRRPQPAGSRVRRGDPGALPVDRTVAADQFRHRGQFDGGQRRARDHRPLQNPGVRRRLSRQRLLLPGRAEPDQRAVRIPARPIQRLGAGAGVGRAAPRRPRGDPDRADARQRRLHPGRAGLSRRIASVGERDRGIADLRRGDDLAPGAGRAAAGLRHPPGPDDPWASISAAA